VKNFRTIEFYEVSDSSDSSRNLLNYIRSVSDKVKGVYGFEFQKGVVYFIRITATEKADFGAESTLLVTSTLKDFHVWMKNEFLLAYPLENNFFISLGGSVVHVNAYLDALESLKGDLPHFVTIPFSGFKYRNPALTYPDGYPITAVPNKSSRKKIAAVIDKVMKPHYYMWEKTKKNPNLIVLDFAASGSSVRTLVDWLATYNVRQTPSLPIQGVALTSNDAPLRADTRASKPSKKKKYSSGEVKVMQMPGDMVKWKFGPLTAAEYFKKYRQYAKFTIETGTLDGQGMPPLSDQRPYNGFRQSIMDMMISLGEFKEKRKVKEDS